MAQLEHIEARECGRSQADERFNSQLQSIAVAGTAGVVVGAATAGTVVLAAPAAVTGLTSLGKRCTIRPAFTLQALFVFQTV